MQGSTKRAIAVAAGIAAIVAILGAMALVQNHGSPTPAPTQPQVPPPTGTTNTTGSGGGGSGGSGGGGGGGQGAPPFSCDHGKHLDRGLCWGIVNDADDHGQAGAAHGQGNQSHGHVPSSDGARGHGDTL
jgi:hypothetical protein